MARTVRTCRQIVRTRRHGCRTRHRPNPSPCRHGAQERHRARRQIGTGANPSERRDGLSPVSRRVKCPCKGGASGAAIVRTRDRRHGAQERHRARRQIGTGANPSERRERHGGRLRCVWRVTVGRLSAGTVGRSGAGRFRLLPSARFPNPSPSEDRHGNGAADRNAPNPSPCFPAQTRDRSEPVGVTVATVAPSELSARLPCCRDCRQIATGTPQERRGESGRREPVRTAGTPRRAVAAGLSAGTVGGMVAAIVRTLDRCRTRRRGLSEDRNAPNRCGGELLRKCYTEKRGATAIIRGAAVNCYASATQRTRRRTVARPRPNP